MIDVAKLKTLKEETHRELEYLREKALKPSMLLKSDEIVTVFGMVHCLTSLEAVMDIVLEQIEKVGGQIVFIEEEISRD